MKTTKRYLFGVISTVLLAAGLVRAADRLDPVSRNLTTNNDCTLAASVQSCVSVCNYVEHSS